MELVGLIIAVAVMVWMGVWWRLRPPISAHWIIAGATVAVWTSVVVGREFWAWEIGPLPISIDRIALAVISGLALYQWVTWPRRSIQLDGLDVAVLIWLACLIASTFCTDWRYRDYLPLTRLLFLNLIPAVVYFVVKHTPVDSDVRWTLVGWLLLGLSLYLSATAIAEWRGWHALVFPKHILDPAVNEFLGRGRGPLQNPVVNGMYIVVGASCVLGVVLRRGKLRSLLVVLGAVVVVLGVVATLTRSVWLAAMASVALVIWQWSGWRQRIVILCVLAVLGPFGWLTVKDFTSRFKRDQHVTAEEMEQSALLRPMFAHIAWRMIQDRPLLGHGFGQYQKYKIPYHYDDRFGRPLQPALDYFQHNVFLSYAVDMGIFGLAALVWLLVAIARSCGRVWRCGGDKFQSNWGLIGGIALVNYVVNGMFHDVSIIPQTNMLLLFTAGAVGRLARQVSAEKNPRFHDQAMATLPSSTPQLSHIR